MEKVKFKIALFLLVLAIGGLYAEEEVFSEGDFKYTVENGKAIIPDYNGDDKNLIILKKLGIYEVISIGYLAFLAVIV